MGLRRGNSAREIFLLLLVLVFLLRGTGWANLRYARQTRKSCGYCHVNPDGGGALTERGLDFRYNGHRLPDSERGNDASPLPAVMGGLGAVLLAAVSLFLLRKRRAQAGTPSSDQPLKR